MANNNNNNNVDTMEIDDSNKDDSFDKLHILSLPNDLMIDILAFISASSHSDLIRAKTICKRFNELSNDDFVYKRMSLTDIDALLWHQNKEKALLLERCKTCHNSEALYIQGVVDYFSIIGGGSTVGLEYLQKAANSGHTKAIYAIGIISLFGDIESKKKGVQILNQNLLKGILWKCRSELVLIMKKLWMNNANKVVVCCWTHDHRQKKWRFTWPIDDGDDDLECRECKCDRELDYLMPYFRISR